MYIKYLDPSRPNYLIPGAEEGQWLDEDNLVILNYDSGIKHDMSIVNVPTQSVRQIYSGALSGIDSIEDSIITISNIDDNR